MVTAQAECTETPPDGLKPIAAFSIFQSNFRNKDYPFALKFGRWILCSKPKTIEGHPSFNLSRQLDHFATIYSEIAKGETDPAIKASYLDSAIMVYDDKLELYKDDADLIYQTHQRKGRFYLENYSYINDGLAKAYEEFQLMFDINPEKTTTIAQGYYVKTLIPNYINKGQREKAQAVISEASKYATGSLANDLNKFQKDLFENPDDVLEYYLPILEKKPHDLEALKAVETAYKQLDNQDELIKIQRTLHETEPTYKSAMALAESEKGNARYANAIELYKEALGMADDNDQKKQINLDIANAYIGMEQIKTADSYIDTALDIDPNFGRAYIAKSRVYSQAISSCTADRKLEAKDRMVYWLVIDYLNTAKQKDPSVTNTVNAQLPNYEAVVPTGEDKFLRLDDLKNGQKVKIDGSVAPCYSWINKTTTVR